MLLLIAGIDTTWSAIGSSLWHLASTPTTAHASSGRPRVWPTAIEEFLRAYAPVTMARLVHEDFEFEGCPMKAGRVGAAAVPRGEPSTPRCSIAPTRCSSTARPNRHAAFGLGIHRCAGSNLARMEIRVALEEFLNVFPAFELADPDAVSWSAGQVRGPRLLPIKVGA